jgi:hypothetical protein
MAENEAPNKTPEELVNGSPVVHKGRSKRGDFPWVVVCDESKQKAGAPAYAVWYLAADGTTSVGHYFGTEDEALAEYERRTA